MQLEFLCVCGGKVRASSEHIGKRGRCPRCKALVKIVGHGEQAVAEPAGAAAPAAADTQSRPMFDARPVEQPRPGVGFDSVATGEFGVSTGRAMSSRGRSATDQPPSSVIHHSSTSRRLGIAMAVSALVTFAFVGVGVLVYFVSKAGRGPVVAEAAEGKSESAASWSGSPPTAVNGQAVAPVSEAEAEAIVARFVAAVRARDGFVCKGLVNLEWIHDDIAVKAKLSAREKREYLAGVHAAPPFWEQIYPVIAVGGDYVVLHPVQRNGELRILVRLSTAELGLNYHEFIVRRNEKLQLEIADVYIVLQGEKLSEAIRTMAMSILGRRDNSLAGWLGDGDKKAMEVSETLERVQKLAEIDPQRALAQFNKLPSDMQREKSLMNLKLEVCAALGPDQHAAAFEEYRRVYHDDPGIELQALDFHVARNDIPSAIASAERLKAYVGDDPLLDQIISSLRAP